jgi:hypothetical protein
MSGIPSWAVKGARVICIDDVFSESHRRLCRTLPVSGATYTLRKVSFVADVDVAPCVLLEEVANEHVEHLQRGILWRGEPRFALRRFRPLHTLESDLEAHFRILLRQPVSDKEPAL